MSKESTSKTVSLAGFVASAGWCERFMNRYGLVLRQKTKIAQKLTADLEMKANLFHKVIIRMR